MPHPIRSREGILPESTDVVPMTLVASRERTDVRVRSLLGLVLLTLRAFAIWTRSFTDH
jgi:hypothetical protein